MALRIDDTKDFSLLEFLYTWLYCRILTAQYFCVCKV